MHTDAGITKERKTVIRAYFQKIDTGITDHTYFDLFTDDVILYFPKFGFAKGKSGVKDLGLCLGVFLQSLQHDIENFNYIFDGNYVVVEGSESGVTKQGVKWPDNVISFGLFCNVFEFEGNRIKRVYIYVDPDFTSNDQARIELLRKDQGSAETIP